jgi:hypothetical protein
VAITRLWETLVRNTPVTFCLRFRHSRRGCQGRPEGGDRSPDRAQRHPHDRTELAHLASSYIGETVRAAFTELGIVEPANMVSMIQR